MDRVIEIGIVPVLPCGPYEVVRGNLAPEPAAVLAEGNAAQEGGLAGELEQALDAACRFGLTDQEGGCDESVAHSAVRWLIAGHVEIQPVAQRLVAVRGSVGPEVPGNAQGADPGRRPGRRGGDDKRSVEGSIVGHEGDGGISEGLEGGLNPVEGRRFAGHHRGGDVMDSRGFGRNRNSRVDEGMEKLPVAAAPEVDADDGDFDDAIGRRVESGGLEVDDESGRECVCSHVRILSQFGWRNHGALDGCRNSGHYFGRSHHPHEDIDTISMR